MFLLLSNHCVGQNTTVTDSLKQLIAQSLKADTSQLELLKDLADEYYFIDFDSTIHYYEKCLRLSKTIPHYEIGLSTLRSFGFTYSFRKSDYDKSLEYFELAQELAWAEKDSFGLALSYSDMGRIFWKKGQSAKALEHHLKVRKIGEEMQSDGILLRANLSLGVINNEEGKNEEALEFYQDGLVQADSLGNKVAKGLILNNMGNVHRDEERFEKAQDLYEKSLEIFSEIKRVGRIAMVNANIGKNYALQNDYNNSFTFYKNALEFNKTIDDKEQRASILSGIARAQMKMGNYTNAIENARKAISTLQDVETDLYYENLYQTIAESYEKLGNHKASLNAFRNYLQAKENIDKEETSRKIEELNALYEQQKNETKIQKLNLEKEKSAHALDQSRAFVKLLLAVLIILIITITLFFTRNRMNQMKQFDSFKNKMGKDLHDNIGASLNHIKMLSSRLIRKNNLVSDQEHDVLRIKKISDELMFDLYDMLWSLDKEKSTIGDLVERIQDHIDHTLRIEGYQIQTNFVGLSIREVLSMDVKTNVYAIFKEAIHNILKHTPPSPILIELKKDGNSRMILKIKNEFQQKNADPQFSTKRGLTNMQKRAEEIEGNLKLKEHSTSFEVTLDWQI